MVLWLIRAVFVVLLAAVALLNASETGPFRAYPVQAFLICLGIACVAVALDALTSRKSLHTISGLFFGLVAGMVFAYAAGLVIDLLNDVLSQRHELVLQGVKVVAGVVLCYFAVSFVLQTKDDFRFVIPYVEFSKQTKGTRPILLDTSVIVDGRIADICDTGIFDGAIIVPRFVLQELQTIADSADKLKRNRGRRGLEVLNRLQGNRKADVRIEDHGAEEPGNVDQRLVALAQEMGARIVTHDYNLSKIAQLRGVDVININDLGNALKPVVLPGETMRVKIVKAGEEPGQGVGYLDDGTMVVGEGCRDQIGVEVDLMVTSVLQTSAGRMIFGRLGELENGGGRARPPRQRSRQR